MAGEPETPKRKRGQGKEEGKSATKATKKMKVKAEEGPSDEEIEEDTTAEVNEEE